MTLDNLTDLAETTAMEICVTTNHDTSRMQQLARASGSRLAYACFRTRACRICSSLARQGFRALEALVGGTLIGCGFQAATATSSRAAIRSRMSLLRL